MGVLLYMNFSKRLLVFLGVTALSQLAFANTFHTVTTTNTLFVTTGAGPKPLASGTTYAASAKENATFKDKGANAGFSVISPTRLLIDQFTLLNGGVQYPAIPSTAKKGDTSTASVTFSAASKETGLTGRSWRITAVSTAQDAGNGNVTIVYTLTLLP